MNWIINKLSKLKYHTNLLELTRPLQIYLDNYNWLFSDLEFGDGSYELPINYDQDYFILTAADFKKIAEQNVQIIWGTLLAVPKDKTIQIDEQSLPCVEGNENIWKNGNIQLDTAEIEIDCVDSSYTIIKFKLEEMSKAFKEYFTEAIELEKFK